MKIQTDIYVFLASLIISAIGRWLKIKHSESADFILGLGILTFTVGIGI